MNKNLVILFVKEPKLGFVKTRLAKDCSEKFALELYINFVEDLIATLQKSNYDFKLCAYPGLDLINKIFGTFGSFLQTNGDLGAKMQNAFKEQFANGYEKITLIGSDTPHITNSLLNESFDKLNDHGAVFGPSLDGGYYLIAFNVHSFTNEPFSGISWSTSEVLKQTLQKLNTKKIYFLQELNDIDEIADLKDFYKKYKNSYFKHSNTIRFLEESEKWKNLMSSSSVEVQLV